MSKLVSSARDYNMLSSEQQQFVDTVLTGRNVLVDACIGSGKTTAIQSVCNILESQMLSRTGRPPRILYLTYNNLLKTDAQEKIRNQNVTVTNYHGFAYSALIRSGIRSNLIGVSDSIQMFNRNWDRVWRRCQGFDVLLLDEYQDIDQEISDLLCRVGAANPYMQRIAVGDMCQKIYDKTCLDAASFIAEFLGDGAARLEFTQCFRLNQELAANIGSVWGKKIVGVNQNCKVLEMTFDEALAFLSKQNPGNVLCLGANKGPRADMQNRLESEFSDKFNKMTLWSKISDGDGRPRVFDSESAIFTTYDGSKGMERPICVIFDWDLAYWESRLGKSNARYEILRNIFLVAASRGKEKVIFVRNEEKKRKKLKYDWGFTNAKKHQASDKKCIMLKWSDLAEEQEASSKLEDVAISSMFDFKYIEHVEAAYNLLKIKQLDRAESEIQIQNFDGLIDLSPCIGLYQEVSYFDHTSIDSYIEEFFVTHPRIYRPRNSDYREWPLENKILYLASLELNQARYFHQVTTPFVSDVQANEIKARLSSELPSDAMTQRRCQVVFEDDGKHSLFTATGLCDVMHDNMIYELKFVSALQHTHFLQLAMYLIGHNVEVGRLWNVRDNRMFEVSVPDKQAFLDAVVTAVTKGRICKYVGNAFDSSASDGSGEIVAFDYYNRVWKFCEENFMVCEALDSRMATGESFNTRQIEDYFEDAGLDLPVPGDLYLKYWNRCAEKIRASAGL